MRVNKNIFLVDDEAAACHALSVFLDPSGYNVQAFTSAEAFLEKVEDVPDGIILLDQRMSGMSGLDLQEELIKRGIALPIIFITGHGDVQMSVKAIKAGAIDFIEKPFSNEDLLTSIREAFLYVDSHKKQHDQIAEIRERHASLTDREREVLKYVAAGMSNRGLADLLGLSNRTIEVHRSRMMVKMGAESLADLVRKYDMCRQAGLC